MKLIKAETTSAKYDASMQFRLKHNVFNVLILATAAKNIIKKAKAFSGSFFRCLANKPIAIPKKKPLMELLNRGLYGVCEINWHKINAAASIPRIVKCFFMWILN